MKKDNNNNKYYFEKFKTLKPSSKFYVQSRFWNSKQKHELPFKFSRVQSGLQKHKAHIIKEFYIMLLVVPLRVIIPILKSYT